MSRKNFHRGIAAVVFAAALALAGVQPAAAQGLAGWREVWSWLEDLWGGFTLLQPAVEAAGDCGPEIDPDGCPRPGVQNPAPTPDGDCGPEIDPDGRCRA
jgi:hypothetical protein